MHLPGLETFLGMQSVQRGCTVTLFDAYHPSPMSFQFTLPPALPPTLIKIQYYQSFTMFDTKIQERTIIPVI